MKSLIITEKPKVSLRIAQSIASEYKRKTRNGVAYYEASENGNEIIIASAAGHLYSLTQKTSSRDYPVFDVKWTPIYLIDKSKFYVKKYVDTLSFLSNGIDRFYIATDYDIEGELLGYNAMSFACKPEGAEILRMKFSTLTPYELENAFKNPIEVDRKLVNAGKARHIMDWFWGINTSRALTQAIKNTAGKYANISAGRVQTPALAILVKREREIKAFKPEPYWEIYAELETKGRKITAKHVKGRIFEREKTESILERIKGKNAIIEDVEKKELKRLAPFPFDLGTMQMEAYSAFGFTPKRTQSIAQSLYEGGYISYPRTASQKLPSGIGYKRILRSLSMDERFKKHAGDVLGKKKLWPRQGFKTDPAHPAIYPTGVMPRKLSKQEASLYVLVVHRFIATFGDPMIRESTRVRCRIGDEIFEFGGERTLEEGWKPLYPYAKFSETILPEVEKGSEVHVLDVYSKEDKTKPPPRFNPASLVKELEKRGLGTKATRADVVDTLYRRDYIAESPIKVGELGITVISALEENVPAIISEELTRRFEEKLENIQSGKESKESILKEAKEELTRIIEAFKAREKKIGKMLGKALAENNNRYIIGKCPDCKSFLKVVKSRTTGKVFVGCSNYPKCSRSYPLPQKTGIKTTDKKCNYCGLPMVSVPVGRRRMLSCIDMNCESKKKKSE
ncbi:MAG: DNA topoisomerase I [Candidatus Hydrothermarchaeaceae archaeon]